MIKSAPPVRVLFVSHVSRLGGGEHTLLDLLTVLDRRRVSPYVLLPAPGELADRLRELDIPHAFCSGLGRLYRTRRPGQLLSQARRLAQGAWQVRRRLRDHDLLHANSMTSALYALAYPAPPPRPVIWHLRDLRFPDRLGRWIGRRCVRVVVPSHACHQRVRKVTSEDKIELIPNGVALGVRSEDPGELRRALDLGDGPLVLTIGQMVPWKGHALAVEVAHRVVAAHPQARFLLVGDDRFGDHPDALEGLRRQIERLGLQRMVHLLGYRPQGASLTAAAEVLLHPAYPEPFGRVVVEAMAAGCPVVALAGDHGPAEILRQGVDGLLVESRTPEALADAVCRLLANPPLRQRLGSAARLRAAELYDRALMTRRMENLYESLAAPGRTADGP